MSKSPKPTWTRYKVLLWLGGAATIAYICRNCLGVAEKEIRADLGIDAFQMGLVNKVVELPQLMDECMNIAKQIAKNSAIAVRISKTLLNRGIDSDINTGLKLEIFGWSLCFSHPDREQRMTAFVQKSKK